jgi:hypothetical protein
LLRRFGTDSQEFLTDEQQVSTALKWLEDATQGCGPDSFQAWLSRQESRFGFSADVRRIEEKERLIGRVMFLTCLAAARPITDLGAGPVHGALTHRVQWVMLAHWNAMSGGLLGGPEMIAELYRNLACANARRLKEVKTSGIVQGDYQTLWDLLFDHTKDNATYPEYLHAIFVKERFPELSKRWW